MKTVLGILLLLGSPGVLLAQRNPDGDLGVPLLSADEKAVVQEQDAEFISAVRPVLEKASQSTVRIWGVQGRRDVRLAYGTVIGDGHQILTKWSQVAKVTEDFRVETWDHQVRPVEVSGVYEDEDLAVLTITGDPLVPVKWSSEPLPLGKFLIATQPDGQMAAYGVVGVLERNLRDGEPGYLGVYGDPEFNGPGVRVKEVLRGTAADDAGLKEGDLILRVNDKVLTGMSELVDALAGASPGTGVDLLIKRDGQELAVDTILGSKPDASQFAGSRLAQMERMGLEEGWSQVRSGFSKVVESDMVLLPDQVGGPLVDLHGNVVGVSLAQASRTRNYFVSASRVQELLGQPSADPAVALAKLKEREEALESAPRLRPQVIPLSPQEGRDMMEKMNRNLTDMGRLADRIMRELGALDNE